MSRIGTLQDALRSVGEFQRPSQRLPRATWSKQEVEGGSVLLEKEFAQEGWKWDARDLRGKEERIRDEQQVKSSITIDRGRKRRKERNESQDEDERRVRRHRDGRKEKREHRKEKRSRDRKSAKEKTVRRKGKSEKRKSKRTLSSSEDDDSASRSSSGESEFHDESLEPARIASQIVLDFPGFFKDLKQLLQTVDNGQAVDISGLSSKNLLGYVKKLFESLDLSRTSKGLYVLPKGAQATVDRLGDSLEPEFLRKQKSTGSKKPQHKAATRHDQDPEEYGPQLPPPLVIDSLVSEENSQPRKNSREDAGITPLGSYEFESVQGEPSRTSPTQVPCGPKPNSRRVIGPAMPSAEMLEAAARLTQAEANLREAEAELENDPMIGPPPPSAVAEAAFANDAERFEEVTRILAPDISNAYEVLCVKKDISAGDLKKRYWKLSLLVHPDKCPHPQAHEAFMALNKSFKDLQDPIKRSEIDHKADEKQAREEYEADLKAQREAAQWRKLRGEALPGDAELLEGEKKEPARDEWMTVLPPERQAGKPTMQSTFFSRTEKSGRGDTSIWTDTPLEKAQRAKMQYLEAYKHAALPGAEDSMSLLEKEKDSKAAELMDKYNENKRAESLVEKHHKKQTKDVRKKSKKEKASPKSEKKSGWEENHPWKPWDREKDMSAGRQAVKWEPENVAQGLGSRFGSSTGERKFL